MPLFQTRLLPPGDRAACARFAAWLSRFGWVAPEQWPSWPKATGRSTAIVETWRDGKAVAYSRIDAWYGRGRLTAVGMIPGGPLAVDGPSLAAHLSDLGRLLGKSLDRLQLQPRILASTADPLNASMIPWDGLHTATIVIDLDRPLTDVPRQFNESTRRNVRSATSKGLKCLAATGALLNETVAGFNRFAAGRRIAGLDQRLLRELLRCGERDGEPWVLPLAVCGEAGLLGGGFFVVAGPRAHYRWGFTDRQRAGSLPVMHACMWEAIVRLHDARCRELDLGGYWLERGPDDPINRFKLGFSRQIEGVGPAYQLEWTRRVRWRALVPGTAPRIISPQTTSQ